MLNIGMETLFLTALIVVAIVVLLFYVVAIRLETKPDITSTELKKKLKKKHVNPLKETKVTFLKELPEDLKSAPAETPEIPETAPIEISEAAPVRPPEEISVETSEKEPLKTPKAVPVEPPETVPEISESPEAPAEAAKEPGPPGCPYHLGYLSSRSRDSFVPDVCLSCPRILDCLHKKWLKE
jgi:hypothetical protein